MDIQIQHFDGKVPSFNISLHGVPGADPFLVIKGCRIIEGKDGPFISYPARKMDNGKYWQHVFGGDKFNEVVMKKAMAQGKPKAKPADGFSDMDSDIPW